MNYDHNVTAAKRSFADLLIDKSYGDIDKFKYAVASRLDELNRCWDELTDALVRQRQERDTVILDLINKLAEAKKR